MRSAWALFTLVLATTAVRAEEPPALFVVNEMPLDRRGFKAALKGELAKARKEKLKPCVELWAPWCPTCREVIRNLNHPLMREALEGSYVIMVNADEWGDRLAGTGFQPHVIPTFYEIGADGRATGRKLEGWASDTVQAMSSAIGKFLKRR